MNKINDMTLLGTWLANELSLNPRYFSKIYTRAQKGNTTLSDGVEIKKQAGMLFVKLPADVTRLVMDDRYMTTLVQPDDDDREYELVFQLTKDVRIGFWK